LELKAEQARASDDIEMDRYATSSTRTSRSV
jgi:hypothetical protein